MKYHITVLGSGKGKSSGGLHYLLKGKYRILSLWVVVSLIMGRYGFIFS